MIHMEDKIFNLLEKMYSEMQEGFKKVDARLTKIENNTKILEDIQEEVSCHYEIIIKRAK